MLARNELEYRSAHRLTNYWVLKLKLYNFSCKSNSKKKKKKVNRLEGITPKLMAKEGRGHG